MPTFLEIELVKKWLAFIDGSIGLEPIADGIRAVQSVADKDGNCSQEELDAIATALIALMELAECPGKLEALYTVSKSTRIH